MTKHSYGSYEFAEVDSGIVEVLRGVQYVVIDAIDVGPREQCILFKEESRDKENTAAKEEFR